MAIQAICEATAHFVIGGKEANDPPIDMLSYAVVLVWDRLPSSIYVVPKPGAWVAFVGLHQLVQNRQQPFNIDLQPPIHIELPQKLQFFN